MKSNCSCMIDSHSRYSGIERSLYIVQVLQKFNEKCGIIVDKRVENDISQFIQVCNFVVDVGFISRSFNTSFNLIQYYGSTAMRYLLELTSQRSEVTPDKMDQLLLKRGRRRLNTFARKSLIDKHLIEGNGITIKIHCEVMVHLHTTKT